MSKPERDKQKEVTAASFRRMAKQCRKEAKTLGMKYCLPTVARIFDAEAKLLRSMQ